MQDYKHNLTEADVKRSISDYLQYGMNQGHWLFMRLNAGSFILHNPDGSYRRRVQGVGKGTADYVVFEGAIDPIIQAIYLERLEGILLPICRVTFLECKSSTGEQSPEQIAFEAEVKKQNCRYYVVRDVQELEEIFK